MVLSIYLAGPDVFLANALEIGERKREACRRFGFEGLFPLDGDRSVDAEATEIFRTNCALMRRADVGLFNLTPFRGPSADPGTVFELGFMFALGKPVYGYSSAAPVYSARVGAFSGPLADRHGRRWDRDGHVVEDFGLVDNLMVDGAIREAGGKIVRVHAEAGERLAALPAFESCLADVARAFGQGPEARGGPSDSMRT